MEPGNGIQISDFQFGLRQNIYMSRPNLIHKLGFPMEDLRFGTTL